MAKTINAFVMVPDNRQAIFLDIDTERLRQEDLKARGKFPFTCADPMVEGGGDLSLKLAVLTEEVGEVAKEVFERCCYEPETEDPNLKLKTELIQVAAVAVAWLEALYAESEEEA